MPLVEKRACAVAMKKRGDSRMKQQSSAVRVAGTTQLRPPAASSRTYVAAWRTRGVARGIGMPVLWPGAAELCGITVQKCRVRAVAASWHQALQAAEHTLRWREHASLRQARADSEAGRGRTRTRRAASRTAR